MSELKTILAEIKGISNTIRSKNVTRKTTETHYPIQQGYAEATRQPVHDILRWISGVELMLETILEDQ